MSFWLKYWVFQALNVDFWDPLVLPNGLSGLWCDDLWFHKDIKHIKANVTCVSLMSFITVHFPHQLVSQCSCFHIYFQVLMHSFFIVLFMPNRMRLMRLVDAEKNYFTDRFLLKRLWLKKWLIRLPSAVFRSGSFNRSLKLPLSPFICLFHSLKQLLSRSPLARCQPAAHHSSSCRSFLHHSSPLLIVVFIFCQAIFVPSALITRTVTYSSVSRSIS